MKIFVIDFSSNDSLIKLCTQNHTIVEFEKNNGALAYSKSRAFMPDIIVVNYAHKPSHGRITATKINERKMTAKIPIYFVDGIKTENEKITHFATPITKEQLYAIINP